MTLELEKLSRRQRRLAEKYGPPQPFIDALLMAQHYHQEGRWQEAEQIYGQILEAYPNQPDALHYLGVLAHDTGRQELAAQFIRKALRIRPSDVGALVNLGNVLTDQGRLDDAVKTFRKALRIDSNIAQGHYNHAITLKQLGRIDEAIAAFREAIRIQPELPDAHWNLATTLLLDGQFSEGWQEHEWRWAAKGRDNVRNKGNVPQPGWDGSPLNGRTVFLHTEQGLGDDLFFLRFAPRLKKHGARICHDPDPKIASIISRLPFIDKVSAKGEELQGTDIVLYVGDLPLFVGMKSASDIPPAYDLAVEDERLARMKARLSSLGPGPYIGVTFRAGTVNKPGKYYKEVPLAGLGQALAGLEATFLALQRLPKAGEIERLSEAIGRPVHDFTALNDDLEEMLALLSLIDEYVTVSNTNVHLRAGTGRTSRVLVPKLVEWRWMAKGDESPWFPDCRVYRQQVDGSWDAAFAALAADLNGAFGRPMS